MNAVLKIAAEETRTITQMLSLALLWYDKASEPKVLLLVRSDQRRKGDKINLVLPSVEENAGKNDAVWLMNSVGAILPGVEYDIGRRLKHDIVDKDVSGITNTRVYVGIMKYPEKPLMFGSDIVVGYTWESLSAKNLRKIKANSLLTSGKIPVSQSTFDVMSKLLEYINGEES